MSLNGVRVADEVYLIYWSGLHTRLGAGGSIEPSTILGTARVNRPRVSSEAMRCGGVSGCSRTRGEHLISRTRPLHSLLGPLHPAFLSRSLPLLITCMEASNLIQLMF